MCLKNLPQNISFKNPLSNKDIGYNVFGFFKSNFSSLDSYKIIPHVSIIYVEKCFVNTLKKLTTLLHFLTLKHENQNISYMFFGSFQLECICFDMFVNL